MQPSARKPILRVGGEDDRAALEEIMRGAALPPIQFVPHDAAAELLSNTAYSLILLDLMTSSKVVVDVLRAAQRTPVIVTAPVTANERITATLLRGASAYLHTPFDIKHPLTVTRPVELALHRQATAIAFSNRTRDLSDTAVLDLVSNAAARFVPHEFLENLQRSNIGEVRLGDHVQRAMTVMFSDIRDFTALSEKMTPQENFTFLNSYLQLMTPLIRARGGFVDKYLGDGIMALFSDSAQGAVAAAVDMQNALHNWNLSRSATQEEPIRMGIGMHCGDLILGTIGENERMQTTVISDAVNVASRIEGLTKTFGVSILVSGTAVDALPSDHGFLLRQLSAVKAKGKAQSVNLYECFDNDPDELRTHKIETLGVFKGAMEEFRKGMFLTAGRLFSRIATLNARDTVAAYYRDACTLEAVRKRGPALWDGAEKMEIK